MSADGALIQSTTSQPIAVGDGFHCSDLSAASAIDPTIAAVQAKALASMKQWLQTWTPETSDYDITSRSMSQEAVPSEKKPFKPFGAFNGS